MQFLAPSSRAELILDWLRSEWDAPPPRPADRRLVDDADLDDQASNEIRQQLLYRDREQILKEVPAAVDHARVRLEEADLSRLYILPCREWYLDTGGSFRIVDTQTNLAGGREFRWGALRQPIDHLAAVDALATKLVGYDATTASEVLIVIAANEAGPYTIIDGSHRATALYRNYMTEANMPWKAVLALGPAIADCIWHIDSEQAQATIAGCRQLTLLGALR